MKKVEKKIRIISRTVWLMLQQKVKLDHVATSRFLYFQKVVSESQNEGNNNI